jgi:poly(A) polymerase
MKMFDNLIDTVLFREISRVSKENNCEIWLIGGYVRDLFLCRDSKDIDIVVLGNGIKMAEKIAYALNASQVSVFKTFGTAQIKHGDIEIEVVGARKESYRSDSRKPTVETGSLEDDQNRRDFTINAMALSLMPHNFGVLTDPFNGMEDLKNRIIRTPLNPLKTFSDDPLRMLRAIRFAVQLDFTIEKNTFDGIIQSSNRISIISAERITDELNKMISCPQPGQAFIMLEKSGLLKYIIPELSVLSGVEVHNNRAHKDNFYHSVQVLNNISRYTDNLYLRWAALLHDVGKTETKRFVDGIGWTFHAHDFQGEKLIVKIFKRLKLPLDERLKFVKKMVRLHMRPIALVEDMVTDSAIRRLLFDAGDDVDDLMSLCEADITSKNPLKKSKYLENFNKVRKKLKEIEEKDRIRNFQPPVDGEEIMKTFGLPPCREIGWIKDAIKDAILDGEIPNEYSAARQFMLSKAKQLGLTVIDDDDLESN